MPSPEAEQNAWGDAAAYERYVGRWSSSVAERFLTWLAIPPARAWLDVGCGTGALTEAILRCANPASVTAVDPSIAQLNYARSRVRDPRASFAVGDADTSPLPRGPSTSPSRAWSSTSCPTPRMPSGR